MPDRTFIEALEMRVLLDAVVEDQAAAAPQLSAAVVQAAGVGQQGKFARQNYRFGIEFDATPTEANEDVAIGLSLGRAKDRTSLGVLLRFSPNGYIQARSGTVVKADTPFAYEAGQTYRFTVVVNVPKHLFTVYVQEHGSPTQVLLAKGYAFRDSQASVAGLTDWSVMLNRGDAVVRNVNLSTSVNTPRVALPVANKLYHGVFPGGTNTWEDDITPQELTDYETAAGTKAGWVYFSDNWFNGESRDFPTATATWIKDRMAIPYIRLMTISEAKRPATGPDAVFTLDRIIAGDFDADFRNWALGAKALGVPVLVEWGTEVNGDWFNWNGRWHGAGETTGFGDPAKPDGPERFVAAYQHIVRTMRRAGAYNISWVWHVNWSDGPDDNWNSLENYYPGPEVVDWVGVSAYGPQRPTQNYAGWSFTEQMDEVYSRIQSVASDKAVIVAEFGATVNNSVMAAEDYAQPALDDILTKRWDNVIGFAWWNERWQNDSNPAWDLSVDTDMRVQDSAELTAVFTDKLDEFASILQTRKRTGPIV